MSKSPTEAVAGSVKPPSGSSGPRTAFLKQRYLAAPLRIDIEYIALLTDSHRRTDGMETLERRAEDHAYALEHLTPVIHDRDRLAANKTRFIRGAIPYANYAAGPFLQSIRNQQQDAQQQHAQQGQGGGAAEAAAQAQRDGLALFSSKFLISPADLAALEHVCLYWQGKCLMDAGESLWRAHFDDAAFLEEGWRIGLYTAPHDPCPEGRLILDFPTALNRGFAAIIADIDARLAALQCGDLPETSKLHFCALPDACWLPASPSPTDTRMKPSAWPTTNPTPRAAWSCSKWLTVAAAFPQPPGNFRQAVQAFWFMYVLGHLEGSHLGYSPGRLDQTLLPWYDGDYAGAVEMLEELFVKMTQIEYVASMSWQGLGHGNLYQNAILGGLDAQGRPADNELSMAIIDAQMGMRLTQPTLSVWYDDSLGRAFVEKAVACVKTGVGYPAFFNLKTYVAHERAASGLPLETIREHAAIGGCTEPTLAGMSYGIVQAGFINHGKLLDLTMHDGVDPITGLRLFPPRNPATFEDIFASYTDKMRRAIRTWQRYWNLVMLAHRHTVPLVYCSALVRDCIARGRCMDDGGAILNRTPTTLSSGLVNAANSLAAVRALVFEQKACSLKELREVLVDDWRGREPLRVMALRAKWGNDLDDVDNLYLHSSTSTSPPCPSKPTTSASPTTPLCWPSPRRCRSARSAARTPTGDTRASRWPTA